MCTSQIPIRKVYYWSIFLKRYLETKLIYICLTFFYLFLQEIMMDHSLRSISYIADIGDLLVIMARRRIMPQDGEEIQVIGSTPKMICHVFESEEVRTYNIMIRDRILCFFNEETLPEFMIGIVASATSVLKEF